MAKTAVEDSESDSLPRVDPILGVQDQTPESQKVITRPEIPFRTIVRVVLSLFVMFLLLQIWQIFILVFVALFLAMALLPARGSLDSSRTGVCFHRGCSSTDEEPQAASSSI